ncbi:MAG TPA: DUF1614 domain-containing protein [Candidatus Methanoculleus thermohydrogenotrophicum]|jgi:uncharacterized membrane protein|nr:DUF1614 domain-containing protein [Candidatus Methanoculleus thermohydrogenotrophicum]NLM81448.1 DUF1614 domain-containing protein [Candidatus Methanoculleus thermohydrogenotrophicum]HOB17316.1 DUF1614 domain-containing protein [Candidatus Methanoculleus thermohydrogenotrophicum]HPZ37399.1 DUF1614 domain-containing protein [Candidatus Methanoculleus thermohydrogenotrophicum]HQC90924.1 DUF1614 domain-containing protein [Candidatus Methanoculleus thermohydrogenotrophicum]
MAAELPAITILPVPFSPGQVLIALAVLIPALVIFNLLLISEEVFESIGFGFCQAMLMTAGALLGSLFNIPLIPVDNAVIAINVGGAAIPLFVTIEMVARNRISLKKTLAATFIVSIVAYAFATPVPGLGITMPFYIPPLAGAATGLLLARGCRTAPELAYAGGTMGTLLGADILNLANPAVLAMLVGGKTTVLSIGGAGIFDGIFITGVLSVLLAGYAGRRLREKAGVCPQEMRG